MTIIEFVNQIKKSEEQVTQEISEIDHKLSTIMSDRSSIFSRQMSNFVVEAILHLRTINVKLMQIDAKDEDIAMREFDKMYLDWLQDLKTKKSSMRDFANTLNTIRERDGKTTTSTTGSLG